MFKLTEEWLHQQYGSRNHEVATTNAWLRKHGKNVPEERMHIWEKYKHLSEYQPNNHDIVDICLDKCGSEFESELQAHKFINIQRYPQRGYDYEFICNEIAPKTILELGVGGDSAISTSIFLAHIEEVGGEMVSVDINPLGTTWMRYGKYPFWKFIKNTSKEVMQLLNNEWRKFDMIFIDTKPTYYETSHELALGCQMTTNMVIDDPYAIAPEWDDLIGKLGAWREFVEKNSDWDVSHYGLMRDVSKEEDNKLDMVGEILWLKKQPSKLLKRY